MARKLEVKLEVDSSKGVDNVKKVTRSIDTMDREAKKSSKNMTAAFSKAKVGLAAIGVAAIATTVKLASMSKKIIDYGDNLHKLNLRLGVSVVTLDKLRKIAALAGVEFNSVTNSIKMLTIRVQEAVQGTGLARNGFKYLNVELKDLKKLSPEKQFLLIAERIGMVSNKSIQNKIAFDTMGRGGTELISMFQGLNTELVNTSTTMSQESVDAMAAFNDNLQLLGDNIQDHLIGPITTAMKALNELFDIWERRFDKKDPNEVLYPKIDSYINKLNKAYGNDVVKPTDKPKTGDYTSSTSTTTPDDTPPWVKEQQQMDAVNAELDKWFGEVEQMEQDSYDKRVAIREEANKKWMDDTKKSFDIANQFHQENNDKRIELEQEYADEIKAIQDDINNQISVGMTDALFEWIEGTKSAKEAFKDFAASFLKYIAKMIIQKAIFNALDNNSGSGSGGINWGSILGSVAGSVAGSYGGGMASGGSISGNKTYLVGEEGPELFSPGSAGIITPNNKLSTGSGGLNVTNNITVEAGSGGDDEERASLSKQIAEVIEIKVKQIIVQEKRYGGQLYSRA